MANKSSRNLKSHDEIMCSPMPLGYEAAPTTINSVVVTTDIDKGVSIKRSELRTINKSDLNKGLKWYDFSIDSLAASGMLNEMSFSTLSESSVDVADRIDVISQQIGQSMNNNKINIE